MFLLINEIYIGYICENRDCNIVQVGKYFSIVASFIQILKNELISNEYGWGEKKMRNNVLFLFIVYF